MHVEDYREKLCQVYGGRAWIVAMDVLVAAGNTAKVLKKLGATRALCIGGSQGAGDLPDPDFAPDPIVLGVRSNNVMDGIRSSMKALANLPPDVVARIDAFDPEGNVRVFSAFYGDGKPIGGRSVFGGRHPEWQLLEDKTVIDALWKEIGVEIAPYSVVDARYEALEPAANLLDQGLGTVWVGDNREGFHGGAEFLRWVRTPKQAREAATFLGQWCDSVRIMPFLEGIPCSVHGMVFPEVTIAFRPCEMVVLRRPIEEAKLQYARATTFWDPAPSDREVMRTIARRVGDHLRAAMGYRGMFTIDGIMTAQGFRPTELNPRFGAAAGLLLGGLPELPLQFLNLAVVEGVDIDWDPHALERLVLDAADAQRAGSGMAMIKHPITETTRTELVYDAETSTFHEASEGDPVDARVLLGPSPMGGYLGVTLEASRTPVGPSAAPRIAAALMWADTTWNLGIGLLEPAVDVRRNSVS